MSMQDPIADMLTRIRNGLEREKRSVAMPASRLKAAISQTLKEEGYISDFSVTENNGKPTLNIELKYFEGKPVIDRLERVSKPSLRKYCSRDDLPKILGGYGTAIVSTSSGVMTDKSARDQGLGGEILCYIS
jgi:small subunit ribosomal protein S8